VVSNRYRCYEHRGEGGPRMGKSGARSGGQEPQSANQRKAARQPEKPHWRKRLVWLGTLGTVGTAVLVGVLVNVLSTQAQRVVPPPSSVPPSSAPASSAGASAAPHLEVDEVSLTSAGTNANGKLMPFKIDIKLLNTGKGLAAINYAKLVIQEFVVLPKCAAQGHFASTGTYRRNLPINPKQGQVENIPISQLVQPNGADRFDLLLSGPLVQRPLGPNVYLYRVHLYLAYNIRAKPLDVGEVLVNFPFVPGPGEYYWNSYYSTHPQVVSGVLTPAQIPIYKRCAIKNSYALHSILSLPARRVAQLAAILPQLRY
jgi:hypothetical protein